MNHLGVIVLHACPHVAVLRTHRGQSTGAIPERGGVRELPPCPFVDEIPVFERGVWVLPVRRVVAELHPGAGMFHGRGGCPRKQRGRQQARPVGAERGRSGVRGGLGNAAADAAAELGMEAEEDIQQVVDAVVFKEVLIIFQDELSAHLFYKVDGKKAGTSGADVILRKNFERLDASCALVPYRREIGQGSRLWSSKRLAHVLPSKALRIVVVRTGTMEMLARAAAGVVKILIGLPPAESKSPAPRGWVGLAAGAGTGSQADAAKSLTEVHTSSLCADDMLTYTVIKQGARADLVADASEMGSSLFLVDGAASIAAGIVREGMVGSPEGLSSYKRNRAHMKFTM